MNGNEAERNAWPTEPWQVHDEDYCPEELWGSLDLNENGVQGVQVCTIEGDDPLPIAKRIRACVNACAGIPDPEEFITRAKRMEEALRRIHNGDDEVPGLANHFAGHARVIAAKALGVETPWDEPQS